MRFGCLHTLAEMTALGEQVDALNLASPRPDPFSTCGFYENFIRHGAALHLGAHSRVWFLVAFRGADLVGYLALKEVTQSVCGRKFKRLDCLAAHNADRPHVVARGADLAAVTEGFYAYLGERGREWDYLELQQMDVASTLYPLPATVHLNGRWVRDFPNMDNCTIPVRWASLDAYLAELAPKLRSNLKRQMRKLEKAGHLELLVSSDAASTPSLLELYCSVEARSWKAHVEHCVGGDPGRKAYYAGLLRPEQPMKMVIHILLLDGVPIAGLMSGSFSGPAVRGLYALQIAFDAQLAPMAPGSLMLLLGMRHAIGGGHAFFNLLGGFGYYKSRWLAVATATRSAQIYRIGHILFWRRLFGDAQRWFSARARRERPRAGAGQPENHERAHEDNRSGTLAIVTARERMKFATLVAAARRGQCEFLAGAELRAVLPLSSARGGKDGPGFPMRKTQVPQAAGTQEASGVSAGRPVAVG